MVYLEHWTLERGAWRPNRDVEIIADMLENRLRPIAERDGGWTRLYRDVDGTLWEMTYPQSEMHGGGPRRLELLTAEAARSRYSFDKGGTNE